MKREMESKRHPLEDLYDDFISDTFLFALEQSNSLTTSTSYRFGELVLHLQVVGDRLRNRLSRSIQHAVADCHLELGITVIALDGNQCGRHPPIWNLPTYDQRHLERLHISSDGNRFLHHNPDTTNWTIFDRDKRLAVTWTADAGLLPDWEDSFPLRSIIHWASGTRSCCLAHAAVIETGGRSVLLTGRGGSGKSTTTTAAILTGHRTCGDDFVMIETKNSPPTAHCLYDTIKLDDFSLSLFPELRGDIANPERAADQKARIHLHYTKPDSLISATPLVAIVLPIITHDEFPSMRPVNPGVVLRALAPTTLFLLRGEESSLAAKLTSLVRALPGWQLRLTQDPIASAKYLGEWIRAGQP